ncbi:hypothetical protein [Nonomuraea endophytica]|uniref:hypothetical protein n=1 Tax=Nonomuraea endophytica TaxID=714136 RepID=UPI0037C898C0
MAEDHVQGGGLMSGLYVSFPDELSPVDRVAHQLHTELYTAHRLISRVHIMGDVAVLLVEGMLVVYGHSSLWHWWSGEIEQNGRWMYRTAPIANAGASARLITARFTELIAAQPHEVGRR